MIFYIVIAIIIVLAALVTYGTLSRKRTYRYIDRLESWKVELMERPVNDELARVKRLTMSGETEEKFEAWRTEWDEILSTKLPEAEKKLFAAEEAADKYRFRKAGNILDTVQKQLQQVQDQVETLLRDLDELVTSEEQNRADILSIKEAYQEAKKHLLTHRSSFQKAMFPLEDALQEVDAEFSTYEEETEQGNYLRARSVLLGASDHLDQLQETMDQIPNLFRELQGAIPEQIEELHDGYQEMLDQGYTLDHLMVEDELNSLEVRLADQVGDVQQAKVEGPREAVEDIYRRIEYLYDQLEYEVQARQQVMKESATLENRILANEQEIAELKNETHWVQQSYHLDEEDLKSQQNLENDISQLRQKFTESEDAIRGQKQAFSLLQDQLESFRDRLSQLEEQQARYKEMLQTLRQDEMKARETLGDMRQRLIDAKRMVQKSNLPGLPQYHWAHLQAAEGKITEIEEKLTQKPLELPVIQQILQEALDEVEDSYMQTKKIIEDARLAERLIQYGNRYRSQDTEVSAALEAAESSFRNYHYEEALEVASKAVQKIEPDILNKLDASFEERAQ